MGNLKSILKFVSKKALSVAVIGAVFGAASTIGVFAAIPHSVTGVISACKDNTSGVLRVIDAEASETCTGSETALAWNSDDAHTAILKFVASSDGSQVIYDTTASRNIKAVDVVDNPDAESAAVGEKTICVKLNFTPEFIDSKVGNPVNDGSWTDATQVYGYTLRHQDENSEESTDYLCGSDYDMFLQMHQGDGNFAPVKYHLKN